MAAIEKCRAAVDGDPGTPRLQYQLGRALIADGNDGEALQWLQKAADAGYPAAQNALAVMLNHGRGTTIDNRKALALFKRAAGARNVPAMANLGALYGNSTGAVVSVRTDQAKSLRWLHRAARQNDPLALARLGWNYGMGDSGAPIDEDLSYGFLERALAMDEESAHYIFLEVARSSFGDNAKAERHLARYKNSKNRLLLLSRSGYTYSKHVIDKIVELGFRFDRPDEEPVYVKEFPFDRDDYIAQSLDSSLSSMDAATRQAAKAFIDAVDDRKRRQRTSKPVVATGLPNVGPGDFGGKTECDELAGSPHDELSLTPPVEYAALRKNADRTVGLCRTLVEKDPSHVRLKYLLGRALIAQGKDAQAASAMSEAAKLGYPAAMNAYGVLLNLGRGVETDYRRSFEWFRKAAVAGNAAAAVNLATAYFMGLATDLDSASGTDWIRIGADRGDPKALFTLGAAYTGNGLWYRVVEVRLDMERGLTLLAKAHDLGDTDATFTLSQLAEHPGFPELSQKLSLRSGSEYFDVALARGDRRAYAMKSLRAVNSAALMIRLIEDLKAKPHPVDRANVEPVYAVDAYMDNEHVLGQFLLGNSYGTPYHPSKNARVNELHKSMEDSDRSFERDHKTQQ